MNEKKYLIYVDILGFKKLAEEIAEKTGFEEDVIREKFLSVPLKREIREIKKTDVQVSKGISEIEGSDNYILMVDSVQTAFETIGKLTTIKISHKGYGYIPLEIGADTREIDEKIQVELINRKEIIRFLKNDIINPYRKYCKKKQGEVKETFVLFTKAFFDDLESLNKEYCKQIPYEEKMFFAANIGKIQERCKIFEFLKVIGYPNSKWYGWINEVYVPPVEYDDIEKTLREKRVVFVTGTPEYGKTYTAVRLMWEYYKMGYEPRWIKGGEEAERTIVRKKLEDIEAELKPKSIIYFEDPFGKTRYEKREGLEREIGTTINIIKQVKDVFVIITSREEVFKEFEKEKLSADDIKELEDKLNLKKPSYDYRRRKEILRIWAKKENCKWLENEYLKFQIFRRIEDEKILPTPLSIRDFAVATVSLVNVHELNVIMREKSEETARAFSKEIKNMSDDKILFLSFLFISNKFDTDFVRKTFEELVIGLDLEEVWEFDKILDWFKDDKINIGENIEFSHPSYSEALKHLLVEKDYFTRINKEIFSKLLLKLSENDENAIYVASAVASNFNDLPEDVGALLFRFAEKNETAGTVARVLTENFDKIPENTRNGLLLKLSEKERAILGVIWAIALNFDKIPENITNLLYRWQKPFQQVIRDLSRSSYRFHQEQALNLISKAGPKIKMNFAIRTLNSIREKGDETIRYKASEVLRNMLSNSKFNKKN